MQLSLYFNDDRVPWFRYFDGVKNIEIIGRGYAFINDRFYEREALISYVHNQIKNCNSQEFVSILNEELPKFDGLWALIVIWNRHTVLLATDRIRGIPLFYSVEPDHITISHSAFRIASSHLNISISELSSIEFLLAGFVIDRDTLYEDIFQVRPGEIVTITKTKSGDNEVYQNKYFHYYPQEFSSDTEEQLEEELSSVLDAVFKRFRDNYRGQKVILPLSGGFDSRLIAAQLKKFGIDNVLCFTYGYYGNNDSSVSKTVAEALGFEWQFFEYNDATWKNALMESDFFRAANYVSKGVSMPHWSDLPVLLQLSKSIDLTNTIFWPGHSIEVPAGSHIDPSIYFEDSILDTDLAVANTVIKRHYISRWSSTKYFSIPHSDILRKKIKAEITVPNTACFDSPISRLDMFDINNRQSKWIVNSVRCYEYFGADWRAQYDYPIIDFFLRVPHNYRFGKRLYINTLRDHIFTGKLSSLAKIPHASYLRDLISWDFRITDEITTEFLNAKSLRNRYFSLKDFAVSAAVRLGIFPYLKNYMYRKSDLDPAKWFAYFGELSPKTTRLRVLLKQLQEDKYLPKKAIDIIRPHLSYVLQLLDFNGIYSLEYLSRVYQNLPLNDQ
ncbi:MAG: asparagine synthase-related protein [Candidatus Hatepunaea meridiana]|nr:asparagine synthase-related protein [Candidatus Hatepunaea meridiana]